MKQLLYIIGIVVLLYIAQRVMAKVQDPPEDAQMPHPLEPDEDANPEYEGPEEEISEEENDSGDDDPITIQSDKK